MKLTKKYLEKRRVPKVLISGLLIASVLGWTGWRNLDKIKNYYQVKEIFPISTTVTGVLDGDTFDIKNGLSVRLLGINAPERGANGSAESTLFLEQLINNKKIRLEYDKYQDDKFGRILAYAWIDCFDQIKIYCRPEQKNQALINEVLIKTGHAIKVTYSDRKPLKYRDYFEN